MAVSVLGKKQAQQIDVLSSPPVEEDGDGGRELERLREQQAPRAEAGAGRRVPDGCCGGAASRPPAYEQRSNVRSIWWRRKQDGKRWTSTSKGRPREIRRWTSRVSRTVPCRRRGRDGMRRVSKREACVGVGAAGLPVDETAG
jgi:hypothetical protein